MLALFRSHAKSWITWLLVLIVSIPFAFWGISQYRSVVTKNYVAKVNGQKIMPHEFQQAFQQAYKRDQSMFGSSFDPSPAQEKAIKHQVLEQLINRTLIAEQASKDGIHVTNGMVRQYIKNGQNFSVFQANGHFNFARYKAVLANAGMSPKQFENRIREELTLQTLQTGLTNTAFVTPQEVNRTLALIKEKRKVGYLVFNAKDFESKQTVTAKEVKAYYQGHKQRFMTPEQLSINYIRIDSAYLQKKIHPTGDQLRSYYAEHENLFGVPPARKAAQILIKPKNHTSKGWQKAKLTAEKLLNKINADHGKNFAATARKYSQDLSSKRQGGDLGWIQQGQLPPKLGKALFSMKEKGKVAGPIKTADGYHLIRLLGTRGGHVKPFAQVKDLVKSKYRKSKASDLYYKLGDKLANLAYEHPNSLGPVARALGLKIETLHGVSKSSGPGVAKNAKIRKAAFSSAVLKSHQNSQPIKLGKEDVVVLHVANATPSHLKPLASVKKDIVDTLKHESARKAAKTTAGEAANRLKSGLTLEDVAKQYPDAHWKKPIWITRDNSKIPSGILQVAFHKSLSKGDKPLVSTTSLSNGNQAVIVLKAVKLGNSSSIKKSIRKEYLSQLGEMEASASFSAYVAWLRQHANITVDQNNMQ